MVSYLPAANLSVQHSPCFCACTLPIYAPNFQYFANTTVLSNLARQLEFKLACYLTGQTPDHM